MQEFISIPSWDEYVKKVIGDDRQSDVARKTGIHQTTISRWLDPESESARSSAHVRTFAHTYRRSVLECFVIAGFLSVQEAGLDPDDLVEPPPSTQELLRQIDSEDLVRALQERLSS